MIEIYSEFNLPLTTELIKLYNNYCIFPFLNNIETVYGFNDNINLLYQFHQQPLPNIINYKFINIIINENNFNDEGIIIGASGGLDSCYAALKAKDEGKKVILIHFQGLNKNFPKETEQIINFAKTNSMSLYIINVKNKGKNFFPDNPFKNQLILSALAEIGYKLSINNIMLGATGTFNIEKSKIGFNVTDTIENYNSFLNGLKLYYPLINIIYLNKDITKYTMLKYIVDNHIESLQYICSCINPNRFVTMLHNNNEKKYNIKLLKYRCGSCFKCAMEYILLYEIGYYNDIDFLLHCYDILAKSKNSHAPELFNLHLPYEVRRKNVLEYKPE